MKKRREEKRREEKHNTTLLTNPLSFKTFLITLLSFTLLFSISCSLNENPDDGAYYRSFNVETDFDNSNLDIAIVSQTSSSVSAEGIISFTVTGSTSYDMSMESVEKRYNNESSLTLDLSDFSYDKSTKKLTLTSSGLTKFQNASASLTERKEYPYTITFKFIDNVSGEECKCSVYINLIKATLITKMDIETMMKSIKCSDGVPKAEAGQIVFMSGVSSGGNLGLETITFDFNKRYDYGIYRNGGFYCYGESIEGATSYVKTYTASEKTRYIASAMEQTTQYREWFGWGLDNIDCSVAITTTGSYSGSAVFTLKFPNSLKSGYALSSEVTRITNAGLKIELMPDKSGKWQ